MGELPNGRTPHVMSWSTTTIILRRTWREGLGFCLISIWRHLLQRSKPSGAYGPAKGYTVDHLKLNPLGSTSRRIPFYSPCTTGSRPPRRYSYPPSSAGSVSLHNIQDSTSLQQSQLNQTRINSITPLLLVLVVPSEFPAMFSAGWNFTWKSNCCSSCM